MTQATANILAGVDARIEAWLPVLLQVQSGHLQEHGRFMQALQIASQNPRDGQNASADRRARKPAHELYDWDQALLRYAPGHAPPAEVRSNVHANQYEGPLGTGWELVADHEITGGEDKGVWRRVWHFGPETERSFGWTKLEDA